MDTQDGRSENVFVDEAGNTHFPKGEQAPKDFYVICAILVPPDELDAARLKAEAIVTQRARGGELKSSSVGNNRERRRLIAEDIRSSQLAAYVLAIDKSHIWRDSGLRWPRTFYKFLHRALYGNIRRSFLAISVLADRHGPSDFMQGFCDYIVSRGRLFDSFRFAPSRDVPLIQIADFAAGTVRRVQLGHDPDELLEALGYPALLIEVWPPSSAPRLQSATLGGGQFDQLVRESAVSAATQFVDERAGSPDEGIRLQVCAVRYLLHRYTIDPVAYVFRAEIAEDVRRHTEISLDDHLVSARVLAPVRDAGVLLCSTDKGVKIPFSAEDITRWLQRVDSQVVPYLQRVERARRDMLLRSHNRYDILGSDQFPGLARYIESRPS